MANHVHCCCPPPPTSVADMEGETVVASAHGTGALANVVTNNDFCTVSKETFNVVNVTTHKH